MKNRFLNVTCSYFLFIPLILVSACVTTPQKSPWNGIPVSAESGNFNSRTGIYRNKEIGFKIWFPSGYEVSTEKSAMQQAAQQSYLRTEPFLIGFNERDSIWVTMFGEKNVTELNNYITETRRRLRVTEISIQEKKVGQTKYIELIFADSFELPPSYSKMDVTTHCYFLDLKNYRVSLIFFTLTRSYDQRKIDQINEIINSVQQTKE